MQFLCWKVTKSGKTNQPRDGSDFQTDAIANYTLQDPSRYHKMRATIAIIEYK